MGSGLFTNALWKTALGMMALAAPAVCGLQTAQPAGATFEVASIKPAKPGTRGYSIQPVPGGLHVVNTPLRLLIAEAWHVFDFQVTGGPKWLDEDRFDIEAKATAGTQPTKGQVREMLQKLLAERFGLSVQHETKTLAVYGLEVAKTGIKMKQSKDEGQPYFRLFQRRQITAERAPLEYLTETLSFVLGRPVVDKTGLQGNFDYKLEWTPDTTQTRSSDTPVSDDDNVPGLTSAIQEQLGLKLSSEKGPVEIVVVERAEKPAAN